MTLTRLVGSLFCQICDFFSPSFLSFFCVCLHTFQLGHKWLCPWPARIKAKTTPCPAATAARPPLEEQLNLWASGWTFFSSFQPFKHHLFAIQGSWSLSQQSLGESQDRTLNRLLAQHWKPGGSPHTLGGHILHRIKARTRLRVFIRLHLLLLFSQRQWWIVDGMKTKLDFHLSRDFTTLQEGSHQNDFLHLLHDLTITMLSELTLSWVPSGSGPGVHPASLRTLWGERARDRFVDDGLECSWCKVRMKWPLFWGVIWRWHEKLKKKADASTVFVTEI